MKKFSYLLIAVIITVGLLSGCAKKENTAKPNTNTSASSKITIGFIVKQAEEMWFQNEWKYAQECADKNGFKLIKIAGPDGEKVLSAIDNLAAQGAQGFVICTPDTKLGPAIMAKAKADNLKVYAVDDQFVNGDGKPMEDVPYMGISADSIGEMVGQALWDEMKKRGWKVEETAACAVTFEELDTSRRRTNGSIKTLTAAGFPANKIYKAPEKTPAIPAAIDAVNVLLTQHQDVKKWLVFSVNDEGVMGGVRAMEGMGFNKDNVIAIGIGGSTCLPEFEKKNPTGFYATCLISPKRHGYETTEMMYKWIKDGIEPPKKILTKGIMITRDNYKEVMKKEGLL